VAGDGIEPPTRGLIIRVSDQLRAGEISLFEFDQEEAAEAKARLDAKRTQRRERYARKKLQKQEEDQEKKSFEPRP
jgi:hypothetical protein